MDNYYFMNWNISIVIILINNPRGNMEENNTVQENTGSSKDERTFAMLCHIITFSGYILPIIGNIVGPMVIWMMKRDEYPLVDDQGKEVLNFQLSILIYGIIGVILVFLVIGIFVLIALGIFVLIMTIIGAIKANEGVKYRYPLNLRLIK